MELIAYTVVSMFISAIILMVVAAVFPGLEIEDFSTAIHAALVMVVVGVGLNVLVSPIAGAFAAHPAGAYAFSLALTAIGLAVAAAVVSGFKVHGPFAIVVATLLLAVLRFARQYVTGWLSTSGLWEGRG